MRILYMGNNWLGWQALKWLKKQGEEIVGLIVHPEEKAKYREEILLVSGLDSTAIFEGPQLRELKTLEAIKELRADLGLSVLFGYILRQEFLDLLPKGCLNIHPALLPYNRGAYPNVWSIVEGTPAGVTIHYIDTGIDTGDIVAQLEVPVELTDTGESLYRKLEISCIELLKEFWPSIRNGSHKRIAQPKGKGTHRFVRDIEQIDQINLDQKYTARDLINILRARTFPPYTGAYFVEKRKKIYLRLQLIPEEKIDE